MWNLLKVFFKGIAVGLALVVGFFMLMNWITPANGSSLDITVFTILPILPCSRPTRLALHAGTESCSLCQTFFRPLSRTERRRQAEVGPEARSTNGVRFCFLPLQQ